MKKISVALLAFNEERNIPDCLESVKWADEIVVVDEKSSDETASIAKKYTKKVYFVDHGTVTGKTHDTMFHRHKQLAISKCTGDWVLQIDADERVTPELAAEIKKVIEKDEFSGYKVPRKNFLFNKWMEHTGWYPDYQVKLFKKGKGKYSCKSVHEQIEIEGEIGTLKGDLAHQHYTSVTQFLDRLNAYTTNDANYIFKEGERVAWVDAVSFPAGEFFRRFFMWEGYKDGLHGLVLSLLQAFSRFLVFTKMWERQGFWEYNFRLDDFEKLICSQAKDYKYWFYSQKIRESNPLTALVYKALRKLR